MAYTVKRFAGKPDWDAVPKAYIESYTWGKDYMPVSCGGLCMTDEGFAVRLTAREVNPKRVMTQYNDAVYKDSCLEFFVSFNNKSPYYMNFETNANGAFIAGYRKERKNKTPIHEIVDITGIKVNATVGESEWSVEYVLPFDIIDTIFGKCEYKSGYIFKGNFYKCGDETEIPHFGSFYPIDLPSPDFHCPQFFGEFVIE